MSTVYRTVILNGFSKPWQVPEQNYIDLIDILDKQRIDS
jgi:hypothetical protein